MLDGKALAANLSGTPCLHAILSQHDPMMIGSSTWDEIFCATLAELVQLIMVSPYFIIIYFYYHST